MPIKLPTRGDTGSRGRRGVRLANSGDVPSVPLPRDPGVQVPAPVDNGLETLGAVLTNIGDNLEEGERRIRTKRDAVTRARSLRQFSEESAAELNRLTTEADFSDPDVVEQYGVFLNKKKQTILDQHAGSAESLLSLTERLEATQFGLSSQAASASGAAQEKLLIDTVGLEVNALAAEATASPSRLPELMLRLDGVIADMAPGLKAGQERDLTNSGRQALILAALDPFLASGNVDEAEALLANVPNINQLLDPATQRKIKARIITARGEIDKGRKKGEAKVQEVAAIAGVSVDSLTPEQRLVIAGLDDKDGPLTLSEKITQHTQVFGKPPTEDQVLKMEGALTPKENLFGKGASGRALAILTENSEAYANNLLSDQDRRSYESAVTLFTQVEQFTDPDTGLVKTRRPELPGFVIEALSRGGFKRTAPDTLTEVASPEPTSPTQPTQPAEPVSTTSSVAPEETIFGLASNIAGPVPVGADIVGRIPIIGDLVNPARFTQAKAKVTLIQRDLVRVLQNNPRFAVTEMEAIQKEIDIGPEFFDTPTAYRNRIIGMKDALTIRLKNATETATSGNVGREERIHSMNVANGLFKFIEQLGVPPRVKTREEARKLSSGTLFIDPAGNVLEAK